MSDSFSLTRNDTAPRLVARLRTPDDEAIDVTQSTVRFELFEPRGGATVIDDTASIVNADSGVVEYAWDESDTTDSGRYRARFVVEYPDNTTESFPNDGAHDVVIH